MSIQGELEIARLEREKLLERRRVLEGRIEALKSDPFELERRAREQGSMMRPGERVLRCCD